MGEEARRGRGVEARGVEGQAEREVLPGRRRDRGQRIVRPLAEAHLAESQAAVLPATSPAGSSRRRRGSSTSGVPGGSSLQPWMRGERRRARRLGSASWRSWSSASQGRDLRPGVEPHPHRQGVDEEADHRLDPGERDAAPGDRGAEDHVVRVAPSAGVAPEEGRPGTLDERVEGQPMPPRELRQPGVPLAAEGQLAVLGVALAAAPPPWCRRGGVLGGGDGARHADLGGLREAGELAPEEGLGGGEVLPLDARRCSRGRGAARGARGRRRRRRRRRG